MLGFNAISEVAIADQPGVTLFLSGVSCASATRSVTVESTGAVSVTGVQLEVGQNPTEFEHEPFATTIHKCQRYYTRLTTYNTYAFLGVGYIHSSTSGTVMFRLPTRMRTDPSHGHSGTFRLVAPNADDLTSINAVYANRISPTLEAVVSGGHGESNGNAMMIGGSNDADAFVEFTAEL